MPRPLPVGGGGLGRGGGLFRFPPSAAVAAAAWVVAVLAWRDGDGRWIWHALGSSLAAAGIGASVLLTPYRGTTFPGGLSAVLFFLVASLFFGVSLEGAVRSFLLGATFLLVAFRAARAGAGEIRFVLCLGGTLALFAVGSWALRGGAPPALWFGNPVEACGTAGLLLVASTGGGPWGVAAAALALALAAASTSRALLLGFGAAFFIRAWRLFQGSVSCRPTRRLCRPSRRLCCPTRRLCRPSRRLCRLAAAMLAVGLLLFAYGAFLAYARVRSDPFAWARPRFWVAAAEMTLARPQGWGSLAFPALEAHYLPPDPTPVRSLRKAVHAHNEYAEVAAEWGLAGLALFLTLSAAAAARFYARPAERAALLPLFALALTFFPLRVTPLLWACAWTWGRAFRGAPSTQGRPGVLVRAVAVAAVALGVAGTAAYGAWAVGAPVMLAAGLAPTETFFWITAARTEGRAGERGILYAYRLNPRSPVSRSNLALLAERTGRLREAAWLYYAARQASPRLPEYLDVARIEARLGREAEVRRILAEAAALEPFAANVRAALAARTEDPRRAERLRRDAAFAANFLRLLQTPRPLAEPLLAPVRLPPPALD